MKRYIIERDLAGASDLTADELAGIATTWNAAVASLGVPYRWIRSYVAEDRIYCIHEADDAEAVLEHALRAGVPANRVVEVVGEFGPQAAAR